MRCGVEQAPSISKRVVAWVAVSCQAPRRDYGREHNRRGVVRASFRVRNRLKQAGIEIDVAVNELIVFTRTLLGVVRHELKLCLFVPPSCL